MLAHLKVSQGMMCTHVYRKSFKLRAQLSPLDTNISTAIQGKITLAPPHTCTHVHYQTLHSHRGLRAKHHAQYQNWCSHKAHTCTGELGFIAKHSQTISQTILSEMQTHAQHTQPHTCTATVGLEPNIICRRAMSHLEPSLTKISSASRRPLG